MKLKKVLVSGITLAGATLVAASNSSIPGTDLTNPFIHSVIGNAEGSTGDSNTANSENPGGVPSSTNSVAENSANTTGGTSSSVAPGEVGYIHPEHGKLIYKEDSSNSTIPELLIGELYEDGSFIIKSKNENVATPIYAQYNDDAGSFLQDQVELRKLVKKVIFEGKILVDRAIMGFSGDRFPNLTYIDFSGIVFSENSGFDMYSFPLLAEELPSLKEIVLGNWDLSKFSGTQGLINGTPNLNLTDEQQQFILKNLNLNYSSTYLKDVKIKKLDLSTFNNSKLYFDRRDFLGKNGLFTNLIGLNEIIFGQSFTFSNYGLRDSYDAYFYNTSFAEVKKVTLNSEKEYAGKFFYEWISDVKAKIAENGGNVENVALFKDGSFYKMSSEVNSNDNTVYDSGVYTIGFYKKPTTETRSFEPPIVYEKDDTRNYGEHPIIWNGGHGFEKIETSYVLNEENGNVVSTVQGQPVRTKEPIPTVYKVAAKDKVVENEIPNRTRYVKDSEKDYGTENEIQEQGQPGREVTRTVYTVDPNNGNVSENTTTIRESESQDKVVRVGGKTRTETTKDSEGRTVTTTTTYTVDETTGIVTPNRTTTYGTQKDSTEVHKSIPSPVRYEKDTTRNYGEPNQTQNGEPGDEVTTTTYSVDPQTGTITPTVGKPVRLKEPTETVVKVAAKDKVVENKIPNRTRYVKDSEKDYGTENETQTQGQPGREVTRTVYSVNPTDGSTTENTTTTRESEPQDKVVRVGGKTRTETIKDPEGRTVTTTTTYTVDETTGVVSPTITKSYGTQKDSTEVHKPIPSPVRYEKDTTRNYGEPNQTQNGQPGDEVTTTTYSVNPQDGTITSTVGQPVRVKEPTETVVKVAAKDKVVENEIPNRTRYVKDSEKDYGTENEVQEQGQPGREVTRTVYTVNPNDGFVTESSTISRESDPKDKVVKVGGKTKTEIVNEGNQTYKVITSYDVNSETGEVISSTTKELIPNENHNRSVEVDDTDPVTIPENNNSNNSTPSLKPKEETIKPKVEKETNKEILKGSFVENNIEKKDTNLDSKKEEKEKTSKDVLTIEKLQKDSLEKINLDNNVQTISLNKSSNVNKNLKLNKPSSTSTDSPKAEISTVNNKPTTEVNKVENVSSSTPSEKVEKTPTVKAPINTGSHSESNILPILGLIGLSGALIVGSSRKRKED